MGFASGDQDGDSPDERPRGVLSPADRKLLTGEASYKHRQTAINRKKDIRDRVRDSIRDFVFLFEYLDADELVDIFDPENYDFDEWNGATNYPERTTPEGHEQRDRTPNPPPEGFEDLFEDRAELADVDPETGQIQLKPPEERLIGVYEGTIDMFALLFKTFYERDNVEYPQVHIRQLVEAALRRLLAERGEELYNFELEYNTEPVDIEELRDRFLDGQKLTYGEFEVLRREGKFLDGQGRSVDPANWVHVQYGVGGNQQDADENNEEESD